jgi:hypothetical protein
MTHSPKLSVPTPALVAGSAPLPTALDEVVNGLPPFINRRRAAEEITRHLFPVSHRSLEAWALPIRHVNGYAIVPTRALFEAAYAKFAGAAVVMGGRRPTSAPRVHAE